MRNPSMPGLRSRFIKYRLSDEQAYNYPDAPLYVRVRVPNGAWVADVVEFALFTRYTRYTEEQELEDFASEIEALFN